MPTHVSRLAALAAGAFILAASPAAFAQDPITKPPVASILVWSQKQQVERYPHIETVYKVGTVKKGDKIHELPTAAVQVDPKIKFGGKSYSNSKNDPWSTA